MVTLTRYYVLILSLFYAHRISAEVRSTPDLIPLSEFKLASADPQFNS